MRLKLCLTKNTSLVPFNYQEKLVGAFHKWLGKNELHDEISLYSLSWLIGGKMALNKKGLNFEYGAIFYISSPLQNLHKVAIDGIFKDQEICFGMRVSEVVIIRTPDFGNNKRFITQSPVLIQRSIEGKKHPKYFFYNDPKANLFISETLNNKLKKFGLKESAEVKFDQSFHAPKTKMVIFRGIKIHASQCPVIIKGDSKAVSFAWDVGIGNSTGIGFGCLV